MDGMGSILKWGAIGVGAYLLWRAFQGSAAPAPGALTVSSLVAASSPVPAVPPQAPTLAPAAPSASAAALVKAAGGVTSLTVDQWNFYWSQLGGDTLTATQTGQVAGCAPNAVCGPSGPMDVSAYIAGRAAAGLPSALPGLSGLGALPVPLLFAYGRDRRPLLLLPRGAA